MSLFPPPEKQGEIKFVIWKSLPYQPRMILAAVCLVAGLMTQLFYGFWWGLASLAFATALSLVKGYDATPHTVAGSEKWSRVTPDEYKKIQLKARELKKWDEDLFDATNPWGKASFIIVSALCGLFAVYLYSNNQTACWYWVADCAVILMPHWLTGVRQYLTNDKLVVKIRLLEEVMARLTAPSDIQVLPMLATAKTKEGKEIPADAKLMLRLLNAPDAFMGVQVQITVNTVQGSDLPYLYCVLLAKAKSGLFENPVLSLVPPPKTLIEQKSDDTVDIVVVRQYADKYEGYTTSTNQALSLLNTAVYLTREILRGRPAQTPSA